jgi:ubiquinone/menaquinone biosynthesis C-methylase UbiE
MSIRKKLAGQCGKPQGWLGRLLLSVMNSGHSKLTDWGLEGVSIHLHDTILDVGCGGGRTVSKLATIAADGKVNGIDYSETSVAAARRNNARFIQTGRVEIRHGSVSQMPFLDDSFDLVTAVETHFFWPNLEADLGEVRRVLKPGGTLLIVAEAYKGSKTMTEKVAQKVAEATGMSLITPEEHKEALERAHYADVRIILQPDKGWICASGKKNKEPWK